MLGGWKRYIVLEPTHEVRLWHVGWITSDVIGFSRISIDGPVRVLVGPGSVSYFGLDTHGNQLELRKIGEGEVGKGGSFAHIPLL